MSDAIKVFKGMSAWRLFKEHPELKKQLWGGHLWNPSCFVVTVSDRSAEQVEAYIRRQKTAPGKGGRPRSH
ncbi:MAG: transposase [Bilifractor sp.]